MSTFVTITEFNPEYYKGFQPIVYRDVPRATTHIIQCIHTKDGVVQEQQLLIARSAAHGIGLVLGETEFTGKELEREGYAITHRYLLIYVKVLGNR